MATLINDSFKKVGLTLNNFVTGGVIGSATDTIDLYSTFIINQTTANQTLTLPNPTDTIFSDTVDILNIGMVDFFLPGGKIVEKQSNAQAIWSGTNWNYSVGASVANSTVSVIRAKAKINLGDLVTSAIVNQNNIASATIVSGAGGSPMVMNITYTTPLVTTNYQILGEISSNTGEAAAANATILFETANKTVNGFSVIFREVAGIAQNCNFEFVIIENTTVSGVAYVAGSGISILGNTISAIPTMLSGNIISIAEKVGTLTQVQFDNLLMRWNSTLDRFEIATISGVENLEWVTKINFGIQSSVINGGGGVDSTIQGTPISANTTFQTIGDLGLLGVEDRVYNIWSQTTNNHYRINIIRKGTTTTDGWVTFIVEKIGITSTNPITGNNGITVSTNNVQLGGNLLQNTNINSSTFDLNFVGSNITTTHDTTGNLGINIAAPLSSLDINGSLGLITVNVTGSTYTVLATDSVLQLTPNILQTITIPAATLWSRRIIKFANPTVIQKMINNYIDLTGATKSIIEPNSSITLQSDGVNWRLIDATYIGKYRLRCSGGNVTNSFGANPGTILTNWTQLQQTGTSFNVGTGVFTAPRAGYYQIICGVILANSTVAVNGRLGLIFSVNNVGFGSNNPIHSSFAFTANPSTWYITGKELKFLNIGDTLTVRGFLDTATAATISGNANFNHLEIYEI